MTRENSFMSHKAFITNNPNLRKPQLGGYLRLYNHFITEEKSTPAVVVLPTGVGKTGLMAIAPYDISNGKVLIIAPQLTIKDTLIKELDPYNPSNFWYKTNIFDDVEDMPVLVEFDGKNTTKDILDMSDIVVTNIHKLQERLNSSPLNFLPTDYFDMIIIDEAHHSVAESWIATTNHFLKAKVIKVTATPLRTDKKEVHGDLVYRYKLSQAMYENYVKSLETFKYVPEELYLTIDDDNDTTYKVEELIDMGIKDEDWISRSVAYSEECCKSVVAKSKELLSIKLENTTVPHKIIAVASNIKQADNIAALYVKEGLRTCVIHSGLDDNIIEQIKKDIENHKVDVVVNVSMLGEGYDHKYLSIGAIFRAYRNVLPYAQFVGRVLRVIPPTEVKQASDNIAQIVVHQNLYLDELWAVFKKEISESEIIKSLSDLELDYTSSTEPTGEGTRDENQFGFVSEFGSGAMISDIYMNTEIIEERRKDKAIEEKTIKSIMEALGSNRQEAIRIIKDAKGSTSSLKRPDLFKKEIRTDIDVQIRQDIVPELFQKYNIDMHDKTIDRLSIFKGKYTWIKGAAKNNGGLLSMYMNMYLKNHIGYGRDDWSLEDYQIVNEELSKLKEHVDFILKSSLK